MKYKAKKVLITSNTFDKDIQRRNGRRAPRIQVMRVMPLPDCSVQSFGAAKFATQLIQL